MTSLPSVLAWPLPAIAIVLATLIAATQWTATLLAYQPALGTPWLDLLGLKLCAPWKLFSWWLAFGAQGPGVFARTGTLGSPWRRRGRPHRVRGSRLAGPVIGPPQQPMARPAGRVRPTSARRASTILGISVAAQVIEGAHAAEDRDFADGHAHRPWCFLFALATRAGPMQGGNHGDEGRWR